MGERGTRLSHHLAADIYGVNLSENVRKSTGKPARAASDLKHAHRGGIPALTDVRHVGQDLLSNITFSRCEEGFIGPVGAAGIHEMAGIFAGALIPIAF